MNKLYSVHDHWTDINRKNDVDIESIDGVITGIKVNGEDFSGISWTQVFTGVVVTRAEAAPFSGTIPAELGGADTIKVIYNDNVYILNKQVLGEFYYYGATIGETPQDIDFSVYPFVIVHVNDSNVSFYTQSPGPQDLTIFELQSGGGSSDFSTAEVNAELLDDDGYYLLHILISNSEAKELFNQNKIMKFTLTQDNCEIENFIGVTFYATNFGGLSIGTAGGLFWYMLDGDTEYTANEMGYDGTNGYYWHEW